MISSSRRSWLVLAPLLVALGCARPSSPVATSTPVATATATPMSAVPAPQSIQYPVVPTPQAVQPPVVLATTNPPVAAAPAPAPAPAPPVPVASNPAPAIPANGTPVGITVPWEAVHQRHRLEGHTGAVLAVAYSPIGNLVLSGSADGTARVWDVATGECRHTVRPGSVVRHVAFTSDGTRFLTADDTRKVQMWDAITGRSLGMAYPSTRVLAVSCFPDGSGYVVVAQGTSPGVLVYTFDNTRFTARQVRALASKPVHEAFVAPDGKTLATLDPQGGRLWEIDSGRSLASFGNAGARKVASKDDQLFLAGPDQALEVWKRNEQQRSWRSPAGQAESVAQSADGMRGLTGSSSGVIELWDLTRAATTPRQLLGHTGPVHSLAFSKDGRRAVSGSADCSVRIWDLEECRQVACLGPTTWIEWEVWSFDRHWVLVPEYPDYTTLHLWDSLARKEIRLLRGHTRKVTRMVFSADGKQAASADDEGEILVWNLTTGAEIRRIPPTGKPSRYLTYSTDGKQLLTSIEMTTLVVIDLATGQVVRRFVGPTVPVTAFALSPDRQRILLGNEEGIRLWSTETATEIRRYPVSAGAVTSLTFSPDGKQFLGTTKGRVQQLWEVETGTVLTGTAWSAPWVTQTRTVLVRQSIIPAGSTYVPGTITTVPGGTTTRTTTTTRTIRVIRRR